METSRQELSERLQQFRELIIEQSESMNKHKKYYADSPPGRIEDRVFIGGSYVLMPILREIETIVFKSGFQPILAYDFDIPRDKTREYTLRLLYACKYAIFEETLSGGNVAEIARASGFQNLKVLQLFMAMNEKKEPPHTMSVMIWQIEPPPQGYLTIQELRESVQVFLSKST